MKENDFKDLNTNDDISATLKQVVTLTDLLDKGKGIEGLWKNIEKNKNGTKKALKDAEQKLIDEITKVSKVLNVVFNENEDKGVFKGSYNEAIYNLFVNDKKKANEFIKRFPHWAIVLSNQLAISPHHKRLSDTQYKNITEDSKFDLLRTPKTSSESIKGKAGAAVKSIGKLFKRFGKMFTGKASKSGLEKKVKAFCDLVNQPWRMWLEVFSNDTDGLSKKDAYERFKRVSTTVLTKDKLTQLSAIFNRGKAYSDNELDNTEKYKIKDTEKELVQAICDGIDKKLGKEVKKILGKNGVEI